MLNGAFEGESSPAASGSHGGSREPTPEGGQTYHVSVDAAQVAAQAPDLIALARRGSKIFSASQDGDDTISGNGESASPDNPFADFQNSDGSAIVGGCQMSNIK